MNFISTPLRGSYIIEPLPVGDNRGWFVRTFSKDEFEKHIGHNKEWVQMNHSFSAIKGTVRGMHFQLAPFSEIKLVRCISGAVFDVIVDLRKDSPGYLQWFGTELSAENKKMMYVPEGFAHGFQTLTDNAELLYQHTAYYNPKAEAGARFDDPQINIKWPLEVTELSARDRNHPYIDKTFKAL